MERIGTIVVPTGGRIESLERTLLSHVQNVQSFGRDVEFVVADDSAPAGYRTHTRGLLRSLSRCHGVKMRYAGLEEKRKFASSLATATDVPPETIEFALFGSAVTEQRAGANRNLLLLDCLDRLFYSADDDTVCRPAYPPQRDESRLVVHYPTREVWDGHGEPCDFIWRLMPDLETAVLAARAEPVDVLGLHEKIVGRSVAEIESEFLGRISHYGHPPQTSPSSTHRVMFSMTGLLGDIGVDERWHLVTTTPEILSQMESEATYRLGLESRIALRCARRTTLTRWGGLHGMFFAADQRKILPPFFPVLRGEDAIIGWLARRTYPGGQFGFLPTTLMHVPSPRSFERGFEFLLSGVFMADVLLGFIKEARTAETPESTIVTIGRVLLEAATLPDFEEVLRARWRATTPHLGHFINSLGPHLQHFKNGLLRVMAVRDASQGTHDGSLPMDILGGRTPDETRDLARQLTRQFGELLIAWPAIIDGTRRLRADGVRPSEELS